ncbi:hypothetical protein [Rubrivirga marina]|uniref:Uncharacterized protein n=1 Tax=Rubrivirga marina TaxID=1196024 RepID=A0A271IVM5_9BACT|nr:hypothetical protein [Rubrivirga marina]PAP75252.1 hypothetical protein BSZ37_01740 [Rubrivirga marina]
MKARLLPLVALLAVSVSAQPRDLDVPVLAVSGLVGGGATAGAAVTLVPGDGSTEAEAVAILVGYPLGVALGMSAIGPVLGRDRAFVRVLRDAARGSALGLGVGAAVYLVGMAVTPESDAFFDRLGVAVLAAGAYAVVPLAVTLHGFEVVPVPVMGTEGERTLGLWIALDL